MNALKQIHRLLLCSILPELLFAQALVSTLMSPPRIIPTPREVVSKDGLFKLTSQTRIILGEGATEEDGFAAEYLNTHLKEIRNAGLRVTREEALRGGATNAIIIASPKSTLTAGWLKERNQKLIPEMKREGYILSVAPDRIFIIADAARGRFYGVVSLVQLLEQRKRTLSVPCVEIRDWPQYGMRGITDDISRGQVSTLDNFKTIIRFLAAHKLNTYMLYMEDVFTFKRHPKIGKGRGALTAAEAKELDQYARKHHVELIPIFQTLGHWENILIQPEYVKYAEFPGAHTLNVSDEEVYKMLDEMIGEVAAAFSSQYFHMAADESWDVGLGANKERVAKSDLETVHAEHYKRIFDILKKYKKKPMMYGDIILNNPSILGKIPKDVIIVDWRYGASDKYTSPEVLRAAGFPFAVSPAVWTFTGPFPNYVNTMVNIRNFSRDGFLNGSIGLLTSNWNDHGGEALRELNYYGYAWTAECAWRPLDPDQRSFDDRFFRTFFGSEAAVSPAKTLYALLSNPYTQMHWFELWRHPMLPLRASPLNMWQRIQTIESTTPLVRSLIQETERYATRNKSHLAILEFVARLNTWFAQKVSLAEELKRAVRDTVLPMTDSVRASFKLRGEKLVEELRSLKQEFRTLWLVTNRDANLQWLMMRYDRQAEYWLETLEELQRTGTITEPLIESQWIYHPLANSGKRDSAATQVPRAFFRKSFTLDQLPTTAKLQLIADTHAKLWINGAEVGEVMARRSLSLIVEHERIKSWNVTSLLKPGTNVIAVEVNNYNRFGSAGFNLYVELQSGSKTKKILSDPNWRVSPTAPNGWRAVDFNDGSWESAARKEYPFPLVRPNYETGRLSWIEQ